MSHVPRTINQLENEMKNKKVVIGLSGGVDSSAALWLLKKQGFFPIGLTLDFPVWEDSRSLMRENICCTAESVRWVKKLCLKLKVPHYVLDYQKDFQKIVVDYFVKEYERGRTPNPCLICNRDLRFPVFFDFAEKMGAAFVATGHYARTEKQKTKNGKVVYRLLMAKDGTKDQTYFLSLLSQKQLSRLIFPLGGYTKKEVYQIAREQGFKAPVNRPESQDFCFVAGRSKNLFLKEKIGQNPGPIIDTSGRVLGKHQGLYLYTLGQRKNLGFSGGPYYVLKINPQVNVLVVTKNKKDLYQKKTTLEKWHFISGKAPAKQIRVLAKTRYRQPLAKATLFPLQKGKLKLIFDQPRFAITPGQFAVFYQGDICLGGGVIT